MCRVLFEWLLHLKPESSSVTELTGCKICGGTHTHTMPITRSRPHLICCVAHMPMTIILLCVRVWVRVFFCCSLVCTDFDWIDGWSTKHKVVLIVGCVCGVCLVLMINWEGERERAKNLTPTPNQSHTEWRDFKWFNGINQTKTEINRSSKQTSTHRVPSRVHTAQHRHSAAERSAVQRSMALTHKTYYE